MSSIYLIFHGEKHCRALTFEPLTFEFHIVAEAIVPAFQSGGHEFKSFRLLDIFLFLLSF